jgi:hypothetical protein
MYCNVVDDVDDDDDMQIAPSCPTSTKTFPSKEQNGANGYIPRVVQDNYCCPNGKSYTVKILENNSPFPGGPGMY